MMHWVPSTKTITITYMTAQELGTGSALSNVSRDGILELARRGKSTIKRAAIVSESRCADGPPGSTAINEANLLVAFPPAIELVWQPPAKGRRSVVPALRGR